MLLCSCDIPLEQGTNASTDPETESVVTTAAETEEETESESEESTYRQSISRSREELESMLTISDEIFTEAESQLVHFEEAALSSTDVDAINEIYEDFEETYDYVSTQVSVASIIYYLNMSDEAAYERYNQNYEKYGDMYDSYMAHCKKVYLESAVRDELFADWTEEEIKMLLNFSPESTELQLKNDELTNEINNLPSYEFTDKSAKLYAEIVTNNNRIAELAGYDNYYDYATKEIYGRDFGQAELDIFCQMVADEYIPRYESLYNRLIAILMRASEKESAELNGYMYDPFDSLPENYLLGYIESLDGSMKEGMQHVFVNRNMIFSDAPNSHPTAFQTYLDDFEMPFCLFGSEGQSTSTIVHEIGHYYSSLYNSNLFSYDLAEVQSQGNEMLLLNYLKDHLSPKLYNSVTLYNMYSNITTIISCVIVDEFERRVYALDSVEGYGSEEFDAIMESVCEKYGGSEFISQNMGDMNDYWRQVATNNPVYYISYAVSMTSALTIYAEVEEDRDAGREMYRAVVEDVSDEDTFLTGIAKAGITSPFDPETTARIVAVVFGE
jgi:hypothetical protein